MAKPALVKLDGEVTYTGLEIEPGWIARHCDGADDVVIGFLGPCRVPTEHLVDRDDAAAGATIVATRMVHLLARHPGIDLSVGVLRQRLLAAIVAERVREQGASATRSGDDVYVGDEKLTVSIAAPYPQGVVIHLGVNDDESGAPVSAVGLARLGINAATFLPEIMNVYAQELASAAYAQTKVRPLGE